ncbi:MAG: hypothetical protein ACRELA_11100 [Candidatus Rokuibacteriota bacterium]
MPIKVMHVGLGPIGASVVRQVAGRKGFVTVGAVDIDPAKVGQDVGEVCGVGRELRAKVTDDIGRTIKATEPDVAVLCTSSSLKKVVPEFEAVLKLKVPIVSTTEELAYPVKGNAAAAKRIDALAKRARVAVLGTGVNPGFVMDALPIALTSVCESVTALQVDRIQDARVRRLPFQKKIGAGLTLERFMAKVKDGSVRHVGLAEFLTVEAGQVRGIVQDGTGYRKGERRGQCGDQPTGRRGRRVGQDGRQRGRAGRDRPRRRDGGADADAVPPRSPARVLRRSRPALRCEPPQRTMG